MKIKELFTKTPIPEMDFKKYLRFSKKMPPLNTNKIAIKALVEQQRSELRLFTGTGSLAIYYKNSPGAVLSLAEEQNGEAWKIMQMQGIGKAGYRVGSGTNRELLLADVVDKYAKHPDSEVQQIIMPQICNIPGIEDARSQTIERIYAQVGNALGMRFSQETGVFIVDVKK